MRSEIENDCSLQGIREVQDHLLKVTLEQPYIGEMIPEAWLNLEKNILR